MSTSTRSLTNAHLIKVRWHLNGTFLKLALGILPRRNSEAMLTTELKRGISGLLRIHMHIWKLLSSWTTSFSLPVCQPVITYKYVHDSAHFPHWVISRCVTLFLHTWSLCKEARLPPIFPFLHFLLFFFSFTTPVFIRVSDYSRLPLDSFIHSWHVLDMLMFVFPFSM